MLFTSLEFLFLFLPIVLGVYFILADWAKNYWLLLASLFFYAWGEPKFVLVMLGSIVFNYLAAMLIAGVRKQVKRAEFWCKVVLTIAVVGNLSVLFVYKYCNFVTEICRSLFPFWQGVIPQTSFILPIGISFFTFQAMSYVIDVYRGIPVQKNPAFIGLYIALFPQLIAGPIVRYTTVCRQIEYRKVTFGMFRKAFYVSCMGLTRRCYWPTSLQLWRIKPLRHQIYQSAWHGWGRFATPCKSSLTLAVIRRWRLVWAWCLASTSRWTSIIPISLRVLRNFGAGGIFRWGVGSEIIFIFH